MEDILDKFNTFTEKPVKFLTVQKDVKDDITSLVKSLYDLTKSEEISDGKKRKGSALPKLIVKDFDEEQIWQQIDLQNTQCWDQLVWDVANGMSTKKDLTFPVKIKDEENESQDEEMETKSQSEEEMETKSESEEEMEENPKPKKSKKSNLKKKTKSSIVDDKFFKLNEMEQFLLQEEKEKKAASDSEDSIDLFDDVDDESGEEEAQGMYNDFFNNEDGEDDEGDQDDSGNDEEREHEQEKSELKDKKSKEKDKKVRFAAMEDSESDDESTVENDEPNTKKDNKDEHKSDFEHRQDRLKQTINRLEEKMLKEAPWQLKGEVDAVKRPQNSLLEEVVDFDLTSRPPPIITEQTTVTLEDIIRQRIKDKAWDDVEKKEKPVDDQLQFRKTEIIDQSKSKLSLAQVYEAEYLKQKQAASGEKEEEEEPEAHKEVKEAMKKLFAKLNALCHYHYTPRAPQAEVKIVSNTPAISMEEVAPVSTSDAALLAPEEVKKKHRGDLMSKEERSSTDKKRERRKKKQLQRKKGTVAKVTEHRNTTKGVEANDKSLKTSKAFFQQLNDEATSVIKKKRKNKGQ
ncbi:U3 small nucleolar ribonucleoprotein protein MPP10 [Cydia strobilella]|uniref:U3 small nucleolar ribonucleoprotein protein MPP10 n=1 Tax=Cydia strobilella TaxID=1100964 RepID=UPI0030078701